MPAFVRPFRTFKFKITCLLAASVLLAGIGVSSLSLLIAEQEMRAVLAEREMAVLKSASAFIDADLREKKAVLETLAEELRIHNHSADAIQGILEGHISLRNIFFNITAFDASGNLVANLKNRATIGSIRVHSSNFFAQTVANRKGVISAPFLSVLSNRPVIVLTQPVVNSRGDITAILTGAIELTRPSFAGELEALHRRTKGYAVVMTDDGTILYHPEKRYVLTTASGDLQQVRRNTRLAEDGWVDDFMDGGSPALLSFRRVHSTGWTIATIYPLNEAFAPMVKVRFRAVLAATVVTLLAGLFGYVLIRILLKPLSRLQKNIRAQDLGVSNSSVFNVQDHDEFGALSRTLYSLSRNREQFEEKLHHLATTDVLTGVNNRLMFEDFIPKALARARRAKEHLAIAFLDLDGFKMINDRHGHVVGDVILIEFARRLTATVRSSDTVVRLAGDEFIIVFEQMKSHAEASLLGQKLVDSMVAPFGVEDFELEVSTSIGIAIMKSSAVDIGDLLKAADAALYEVKAQGRNGYKVVEVEGTSVAGMLA